MRLFRWTSGKSEAPWLAMSASDPQHQEWRLRCVERDLGLPVKAVVLGILFYYLFLSNWVTAMPVVRPSAVEEVNRGLAQDVVRMGFLIYVAINIGVAVILVGMDKLALELVQRAVFTLALFDGLFLSGMGLITGGTESPLYWLFTVLIVRNSLSFTAAPPQIVLNLLMCLFFAMSGLLDSYIAEMDGKPPGELPDLGKPFVLRLLLLASVSAWCYGLQVLLHKQLRSLEEVRELALRREQLEASGRLAAEIAHQLKNPLGIINNAAFTLQRTVKEGKGTITQQIQIIREEVERSDRIITELMGYAQLAEGRVEKLDVKEELERAILQVFPPAVKYEMQIHRDYAPGLPQLLAQRNHIAEILVNVMHNAREASGGRGNLWVSAAFGDNYSIVITIADDGPGIAPELLERIFEPYFSTREKGSGLGLAIVKHNTEIYGGKVRVESELGKGARFVLQFPARTLMKLRK